MSTRRGRNEDDDDEQPPVAKRQRFVAQESPPSLDSLNDDCLLNIFSHSSIKDLNTIAMLNRRFRVIRAHESLNQAREGTIIIREGSTWESFWNAIINNNWNDDFQGNMTTLNLTGVGRIRYNSNVDYEIRQLSGVTSLRLTMYPGQSDRDLISCRHGIPLAQMFPNVETVDLCSLNTEVAAPFFLCQGFARNCPHLSKLTWNGCDNFRGLILRGNAFNGASDIIELYLDDCRFVVGHEQDFSQFSDLTNTAVYSFMHCRRLERLSIKNAMYHHFIHFGHEEPVSHEVLIKMVRCHPTLRWLRSDLSPANIAMLRRERPEITFVSY